MRLSVALFLFLFLFLFADAKAQNGNPQQLFEQFAGSRTEYYVAIATEWSEKEAKRLSGSDKEIVTLGQRSYLKNREVIDTQFYLKADKTIDRYSYRFKRDSQSERPGGTLLVFGEDNDKRLGSGTFDLSTEIKNGNTHILCRYRYETADYKAEGNDRFMPPSNQGLGKVLYEETSQSVDNETGVSNRWRASYLSISPEVFHSILQLDPNGKPKVDRISLEKQLNRLYPK